MKLRVLFLLLFASLLVHAQTDQASAGYKPGDIAGDFKLKNINGKMVSLADFPDTKGFIVIFTCNHCPFAQAYEQRIIKLHQKYAASGYPVIAINSNDPEREPEDSYDNMRARAEDRHYPFVYLFDETQEIARTYGATRTPHVFILQKQAGRLNVVSIGAIDDNPDDELSVTSKYVESNIQALLLGKAIKYPFTRAIGCTIKWKKFKSH